MCETRLKRRRSSPRLGVAVGWLMAGHGKCVALNQQPSSSEAEIMLVCVWVRGEGSRLQQTDVSTARERK